MMRISRPGRLTTASTSMFIPDITKNTGTSRPKASPSNFASSFSSPSGMKPAQDEARRECAENDVEVEHRRECNEADEQK